MRIEKVTELPPPAADKFILWLDGFLTERATLNEKEVDAIKARLREYTMPKWIVEQK